MNTAALHRHADAPTHDTPLDPVDLAVWLFMAVATCLFSLFIVAYAVRMNGEDWSSIALPWQLWLSTAWLFGAGLLLHRANQAAQLDRWPRCRALWLAGGACTALFMTTQLWAWQSLQNAQVLPQGNPAAGFFYLLTAMHGLHVLGGLVAWGACAPVGDPALARADAWRLGLCERYWHFLLAVWLVLYAALAGLTPEFVRALCGPG